jgi:uncharacterized protein involved in exopolysaccharide biosynthesis
VAGILIFCKGCGKQVPSAETRDGLCLDCQVTRALADLRSEHARLSRKRDRYASRGANTASTDAQLARVESRMAERIRELIPSDRAAAERLKKELQEARRARYDLSSGGRAT